MYIQVERRDRCALRSLVLTDCTSHFLATHWLKDPNMTSVKPSWDPHASHHASTSVHREGLQPACARPPSCISSSSSLVCPQGVWGHALQKNPTHNLPLPSTSFPIRPWADIAALELHTNSPTVALSQEPQSTAEGEQASRHQPPDPWSPQALTPYTEVNFGHLLVWPKSPLLAKGTSCLL